MADDATPLSVGGTLSCFPFPAKNGIDGLDHGGARFGLPLRGGEGLDVLGV